MQDSEKVNDTNTDRMECRRCGICCSLHQAIVSPEELTRILKFLGISTEEWVEQYSDARWQSSKNYLIKHDGSGCLFLKYTGTVSRCEIHPARPACCSDWLPSLEKKECREGLNKALGI